LHRRKSPFHFQVEIGLRVTDERFGLRVMLQLAAGAHADIGRMRVGSRDIVQLDLGIRRPAAAYAINEITDVGVWFVRVSRRDLLAFVIENLEARFTSQRPSLTIHFEP